MSEQQNYTTDRQPATASLGELLRGKEVKLVVQGSNKGSKKAKIDQATTVVTPVEEASQTPSQETPAIQTKTASAELPKVGKPSPKRFTFQRVRVADLASSFKQMKEQKKRSEEEEAQAALEEKSQLAEYKLWATEEIPILLAGLREVDAVTGEEDAFTIQEMTPEISKAKSILEAELNNEHPVARRYALQAYMPERIKMCPADKDSIIDVVRKLTSLGCLTQVELDSRGSTRLLKRSYVLGPVFQNFDNEEDRTLVVNSLKAFSALTKKVNDADREAFNKSLAALRERANSNPISLDELTAKKPGFCLFQIASSQEVKKDRRSGQERKFNYPGGWYMIHSDGNKVTTVDALPPLQEKAEELRVSRTHIFVDQVSKDMFMANLAMEEKQAKRAWLFHRFIRRGFSFLEKEKKNEAAKERLLHLKEQMRGTATMSYNEWFRSKKSDPGILFIDWVEFSPFKPFIFKARKDREEVDEIPFPELFFTIERNVQGKMKVLMCPDFLKNILVSFKEYEMPGKNFANLGVLGVILRIAFEATLNHKDQRSSDKPTASAPADTLIAEMSGQDLSGVEIPDASEEGRDNRD